MPDNTEEIGSLVGELDVERAIDLDEPRVFRTRTTLALLNSPFYSFDDVQIYAGNGPVEVRDESCRVILGYATLEITKSGIMADLVLDAATPERLAIENRLENLYARIEGLLVLDKVQYTKTIPVDVYGGPRKVEALFINTILISREKPTDPRASPLGEPTL